MGLPRGSRPGGRTAWRLSARASSEGRPGRPWRTRRCDLGPRWAGTGGRRPAAMRKSTELVWFDRRRIQRPAEASSRRCGRVEGRVSRAPWRTSLRRSPRRARRRGGTSCRAADLGGSAPAGRRSVGAEPCAGVRARSRIVSAGQHLPPTGRSEPRRSCPTGVDHRRERRWSHGDPASPANPRTGPAPSRPVHLRWPATRHPRDPFSLPGAERARSPSKPRGVPRAWMPAHATEVRWDREEQAIATSAFDAPHLGRGVVLEVAALVTSPRRRAGSAAPRRQPRAWGSEPVGPSDRARGVVRDARAWQMPSASAGLEPGPRDRPHDGGGPSSTGATHAASMIRTGRFRPSGGGRHVEEVGGQGSFQRPNDHGAASGSLSTATPDLADVLAVYRVHPAGCEPRRRRRRRRSVPASGGRTVRTPAGTSLANAVPRGTPRRPAARVPAHRRGWETGSALTAAIGSSVRPAGTVGRSGRTHPASLAPTGWLPGRQPCLLVNPGVGVGTTARDAIEGSVSEHRRARLPPGRTIPRGSSCTLMS